MSSKHLNPQIKKRARSEKRLIKLQKIGFELQAQKLRKEYSNKHLLKQMKMKSQSKKKVLTQIPEGEVGHFLDPTKIISVTAHKWAIFDYYSSKYIRGYRARDSHSLSVFSKLVVFCAVNTLMNKHKLDLSRFETIVTEGLLKMHPKPCHLKADDIISLEDLLYMMIMDENEIYETMLAVNVGAYLQKKRQKQYYSVFDANDKHIKQHLKQFYELVNSYTKLLKLQNIKYLEAEPHSRRQKNKCSASDIAILSIQCLKIPLFNQIMRKLHHTVKVKYIDSEAKLTYSDVTIHNQAILNKYIPYFSVCRNWEENNFMDSHCSVLYQNSVENLRPVVIVLLGSYGPSDREKDIQQIAEWYMKNGSKKDIETILENNKSLLPKRSSGSKLLPSIKNSQGQSEIEKKLKVPETKSRYDQAIIKSKNRSLRFKTQI